MFGSKSKISLDFLLDLLFPRFCVGCGQEGSFLCPACERRLAFQELSCPFCHKVNFGGHFCPSHRCRGKIKGLIHVCKFDPLARRLVYAFKYEFLKGMGEVIGCLMAERLRGHPLFVQNPILVPVPVFFARRWQRGFNQAEVLAGVIARELGLETVSLITKVKNTPPQAKLGAQERLANLHAAFTLSAVSQNALERYTGKTLVLVDDVYTTGATLNEVAESLSSLRPKSIWGLVFARGS